MTSVTLKDNSPRKPSTAPAPNAEITATKPGIQISINFKVFVSNAKTIKIHDPMNGINKSAVTIFFEFNKSPPITLFSGVFYNYIIAHILIKFKIY